MISLIVAIFAFLISIVALYLISQERKKPKPVANDGTSRPLQLQAYERLVMLAERIAIPNIVSRANQPGMDAKQMQLLLLESIKQEYEYNISQQIYVSQPAWDAIRNLKDQNMLIINQVGSTLPPQATGLDLNRRLLEYTMSNKKGKLHEIVMEALNFEAKKAM